ncbi:matrixin family metalloprotease [Caulobacter segnis]|uniref:matrixin family metalloprotease n=1 Tax=Caulobacter segnis TaxID=88688 RepID=UPI00241031E7|nr:matrixin family metalloprotease [Caulobacter segnis]
MPVLSGERWQSTGLTTTVTWSFATSNYASLKTQYSGYRDFSTSINNDFRDEIIAAFNAWEAAANIDFVQVADSASVNIRIGDYAIDGRAAPGGQSTLGQAHNWWSGTYYRAAQIVFDVDAYDSSADFYWTALHEIGHAIGLDHATLSTAVMYYLKTPSSAASLTADDIAGVTAIYGAPGSGGTGGPARDDYAGNATTSGRVTVGGAVSGVIEIGGDVDWFRVELSAGRAYRLDLKGKSSGQGTLEDPYLEVFNAAGVKIDFIDDGGAGLDSSDIFRPATTGIYYLAASGFEDDETGTYRLSIIDTSSPAGSTAVTTAAQNILRLSSSAQVSDLSTRVAAGSLSLTAAIGELVKAADATTSVATLSYQFFTGKIPGGPGLDYLVSPSGPNPNNLNSAYFQSFNLENRYINFAVNLGRDGEGRAGFQAEYGGLSLFAATKKAYGKIFGNTPDDARVTVLLSGGRDGYFASYGGDGPSGQGTKAAMVGWLLAEAEKADLGVFARSNAAFLTDLADGAAYGVDLVGVYGQPSFNYG